MRKIEMEEPERIKRLPHYKGLPVPVTTLVVDGVPNFKSAEDVKTWECKEKGLCAICGQPLEYYIAFAVTEEEAKTRLVYENPLHEECLRYSFEICPWLFYSKSKYTDSQLQNEKFKEQRISFMSSRPPNEKETERPKYMGVYITRSYENVLIKNPINRIMYRVCKVGKAVRLEWIEGKEH